MREISFTENHFTVVFILVIVVDSPNFPTEIVRKNNNIKVSGQKFIFRQEIISQRYNSWDGRLRETLFAYEVFDIRNLLCAEHSEKISASLSKYVQFE